MTLVNFLQRPQETVVCNLCGSHTTQRVTNRSRFDLPLNTVLCLRCGLLYHNPRMTLAGFAEFYAHDYRELIGHADPPAKVFAQQVAQGQRIAAFIGPLPAQGQLVDVGSGPGGQLWALQQHYGWRGLGIEPAQEHVAWARQTHDLDLRPGLVEQVTLPAASVDLAVVSQTLNHLLDPLGTLRQVHQWLKPEGRLFLEVMDFVYLVRLASLPMASTIDHPYMFCPATLRALLTQAGFAVEKWEADADLGPTAPREPGQPSVHMRVLARKTPPQPPAYPTAAVILAQIQANQKTFEQHQLRKRFWLAFERLKGYARRFIGPQRWHTLRQWLRKAK